MRAQISQAVLVYQLFLAVLALSSGLVGFPGPFFIPLPISVSSKPAL